MNVALIRSHFIKELANENFTIDRTGQKTIELIGASFIADEPAIFGEPNAEYIEKELEWYQSGSTNIKDIYGEEREPPAAWLYAANKHGEINSNYGHLIDSDKYFNQYQQVITELTENPDGRRASMIYTRPSIWMEYNENGKSDFICTNAVTYYIRDDKLHAVVQMRSNDVIFGYRNDVAWQNYVLHNLCNALAYNLVGVTNTVGVTPGTIYWQVQNLHVYERHFNLVK
jgi:thymidylate synthase